MKIVCTVPLALGVWQLDHMSGCVSKSKHMRGKVQKHHVGMLFHLLYGFPRDMTKNTSVYEVEISGQTSWSIYPSLQLYINILFFTPVFSTSTDPESHAFP